MADEAGVDGAVWGVSPARPQSKSQIVPADLPRPSMHSPSPPAPETSKTPLSHTLTQVLVVAF